MTAFTRLGSSIWDWEPWTDLDERCRIFWLALYTSAEARRNVVGLWHGGIPTMADAARMPADHVVEALDTLLHRGMVEYDRNVRVLRLCELPDAGELPSNGHVIRSWWRKFSTVPACAVRDAHVRTLQWIVQEGFRAAGKTPSPHHNDAWASTFGTIVVPEPRRRGMRRLSDPDTSTSVQPSLFRAMGMPSGNGIDVSQGSANSQVCEHPVDNSDSGRQSNNISGPETVPRTVPGTVSGTNRIPDPGSRIPDLFSDQGERDPKRVLTLVPAATPYTAGAIVAVMAEGRWDPQFDKTHQLALDAMIPSWVERGTTLDDFRALSEASRLFGDTRSARWILGCDLAAEISIARKRLELRDIRAAAMAESSG